MKDLRVVPSAPSETTGGLDILCYHVYHNQVTRYKCSELLLFYEGDNALVLSRCRRSQRRARPHQKDTQIASFVSPAYFGLGRDSLESPKTTLS